MRKREIAEKKYNEIKEVYEGSDDASRAEIAPLMDYYRDELQIYEDISAHRTTINNLRCLRHNGY